MVEIQGEYLRDLGANRNFFQNYGLGIIEIKNFDERCQVEIDLLKKIQEINPTNKLKKSRKNNKKALSTRQNVILLLSLMYGSPELTDDLINKTEVAEFIESLQSIDTSNVYDFVCSSVASKAESIKE